MPNALSSDAPLPENFGPPRVTLRDIAKHLGVSHVAVSLALRDRPGVSDDLRERIRKAADKLGYRPDPVLAALNNYRHGRESRPIRAALGWITLWRDPARMHALRELDAYWQGAKQVAEKHGYHLYEFSPDTKHSLAAVQRIMVARNIEGLIFSPPDSWMAETPPAMLDWDRFSVVRLGRTLVSHPYNSISSGQMSNTALAIACMRQRGYRRIGFVTSIGSNRFTNFLPAFLRSHQDIPPVDRIPHIALPEKNPAEDRILLADWIKTYKPDAVFSNLGNIQTMLGSIGCEVPKKIGLAVTSVHDCDADSGIDQSPLEIGKTACETLISLLTHGHKGIPVHRREILVEGCWVDGKSLPPRTAPMPRPKSRQPVSTTPLSSAKR